MIHVARTRQLEHAETLQDYFSDLLVGDSPIVLLGTLFWPMTLLICLPIGLVWLCHRRAILVRKALTKLNGGSL